MKKNHQYNLFEEANYQQRENTTQEDKAIIRGLKETNHDSRKEKKLKNLIDGRLKKIENLERLLEKDKKAIDHLKKLFKKTLEKDFLAFHKRNEDFIAHLIKRYEQRSFTKSQKETLHFLIKDAFENLVLMGYSSESFQELIMKFNTLNREVFNSFEDQDAFDDEESKAETTKEVIMDMLENIGIVVDDSILEGLDINDKDFQTKLEERIFEFRRETENEQKKAEQQELKANTNKDFSKLYKSLVKKVHPDLTTDANEKEHRELLMKELSEIWDQRDYHKLLTFQAKILDDSSQEMILVESQLSDLADALFLKVKDLERQRHDIKRSGENEFYYKNFFASSNHKIHQKIELFRSKLKQDHSSLEKDIKRLKNQKTTKDYLREVKNELMISSTFGFFDLDDDW